MVISMLINRTVHTDVLVTNYHNTILLPYSCAPYNNLLTAGSVLFHCLPVAV